MRRGARDPFLRKNAYAQSVYAPARICPAMHHIHTFSFFRKELCNKKQPAVFTPRAAIFFRLFDDIDKIIVRSGEKEKHDDQSEQSEENDLENKIPLGHRFQTDHGN